MFYIRVVKISARLLTNENLKVSFLKKKKKRNLYVDAVILSHAKKKKKTIYIR